MLIIDFRFCTKTPYSQCKKWGSCLNHCICRTNISYLGEASWSWYWDFPTYVARKFSNNILIQNKTFHWTLSWALKRVKLKQGCTRSVLCGFSHSQFIHLHKVPRSITLPGCCDRGRTEPGGIHMTFWFPAWQYQENNIVLQTIVLKRTVLFSHLMDFA